MPPVLVSLINLLPYIINSLFNQLPTRTSIQMRRQAASPVTVPPIKYRIRTEARHYPIKKRPRHRRNGD